MPLVAHIILYGRGCYSLLLLQSSDDNTSLSPCIGVLVLFLVVGLVVKYVVNKPIDEVMQAAAAARARQLTNAKTDYDDSIKKLKLDPTNADLRQRTLELGRKYSTLTRNKEGVTVYDEVAIMNDINAACAAGASAQGSVLQVTLSVEERLGKLAELKSKGLIDDQEYNERRKRILDEV